MSIQPVTFPSKKELKVLFRHNQPTKLHALCLGECNVRTYLASQLAYQIIQPDAIKDTVSTMVHTWNRSAQGPSLSPLKIDFFVEPLVEMVKQSVEWYQAEQVAAFAESAEVLEEKFCDWNDELSELEVEQPKMPEVFPFPEKIALKLYLEMHPRTNTHALRVHNVTKAVAEHFATKRYSEKEIRLELKHEIHNWTKSLKLSLPAMKALQADFMQALKDCARQVPVLAPADDSAFWLEPKKTLVDGAVVPQKPAAAKPAYKGCFRRWCNLSLSGR